MRRVRMPAATPMPLYQMTIFKGETAISVEPVRAVTAEQARTHLRLRFARCHAGETLVLTREGLELGRIGPRRVSP